MSVARDLRSERSPGLLVYSVNWFNLQIACGPSGMNCGTCLTHAGATLASMRCHRTSVMALALEQVDMAQAPAGERHFGMNGVPAFTHPGQWAHQRQTISSGTTTLPPVPWAILPAPVRTQTATC